MVATGQVDAADYCDMSDGEIMDGEEDKNLVMMNKF